MRTRGRILRIGVVAATLVAGLVVSGPAHATGPLIVNTLSDELTPSDGLCSLREAIVAANADSTTADCGTASGTDAIDFAQSGTYTLSLTGADDGTPNAATGDLDITQSVTIQGEGWPYTFVGWSASESHPDRVFDIQGDTTVGISDMTIQNGNTSENTSIEMMGGGIRVGVTTSNPATLNLTNAVVQASQSHTWGGGIAVRQSGTLNLLQVSVDGNTAKFGAGLGTNVSGTSNVVQSALINNGAHSITDGYGGGIWSAGTVSVTNSTISGNQAYMSGTGTVNGGAISASAGTVRLSNSTVSNNGTDTTNATGGNTSDGAMFGSFEMKNSILANSNPGHDCSDMTNTITSRDYNIIENNNGCTYSPPPAPSHDKIGFDPGLSSLGDHGGPTLTELPAAGTLAVSKIPPASCKAIGASTALLTDQRGVTRPQGTNCDIGAVERLARPAKPTMTKPDTPFQRSVVLPIVWTAVNTPLGPAQYELEERITRYNENFSSTSLTTGLSQHQFTEPRVRGVTYCSRARAVDIDGNRSFFSNRRCSAVALDDQRLTPSPGNWTTVTGSAFYVGKARSTKTQGATLSLAGVQAMKLAVMADACPTCGQIDLFVGTSKVAHFDLHAAALEHRHLFLKFFSTLQSGTVKVAVTSSGQKVVIDGLGVYNAAP